MNPSCLFYYRLVIKMSMITNIRFNKILDNFHNLKRGVSEWIVAIDTKQYDLQERVKELEYRLQKIEELHNMEDKNV